MPLAEATVSRIKDVMIILKEMGMAGGMILVALGIGMPNWGLLDRFTHAMNSLEDRRDAQLQAIEARTDKRISELVADSKENRQSVAKLVERIDRLILAAIPPAARRAANNGGD